MDGASEPSAACLEVPEAAAAVQGEEEEEGQVIGYFDLENSGLQLVEGDSTFYLPPEALGEHVLMSEDGKDGQPIIVVVEEGSEDAVVQALTRNAQAMMGDQAEFTMNQLENAITASLPEQFSGVETVTTAGGQQLLILSEDASESIADQEGASNEESADVPETGLVFQEGPEESLPEHLATAADSGQAELQRGPQELPDRSNSESPNAVSEEQATATDSGQAELEPEPRELPDRSNSESPNAVSEEQATTTDNGQAELEPEPRELLDGSNSKSLNAVSEEKAAGSPATPVENSECIPQSESEAEPQAAALVHSGGKNGNLECSLVSESKTVPLKAAPVHENIEGDMPCKSAVLALPCSLQKNPALLPDREPAHDTEDGLSSSMSMNSGPSSDWPLCPAAVMCAEGAASKTCLLAQETEHEVPVDGSTSEITQTPSAMSPTDVSNLDTDVSDISFVKEAGTENVDHFVRSEANKVVKASNDIPSIADTDIQHGEAKEGNLCTDQRTSEHSRVDATPTCQLESKSSKKVAKMEPQLTDAISEKPLKKRLRPEICVKTADQAVSLESEFKTPEVPSESEKVPLQLETAIGHEERHASSSTACPLHKETEHVVSINVAKLSGRTKALTRGKVHKLISSKAREKATSNGDPTPIPNPEAHQACSLFQETGDTASLHEHTNSEGKETRKDLTGTESSDELPGEYCSSRDRAVADICPEKPSSLAHQREASMVEGMMLSAITPSSKIHVQGEDGLANSATKHEPATPGEPSEISRSANVNELDEPAGKPVQPQEDTVFMKRAGGSVKLVTEEPECLRKTTEGKCLDTSPAQAETVFRQKPTLLDGETVQDTKGKHLRSTTCLEKSLQSEQNIEVLSSETKTEDDAPRKLTEKGSLFKSSSDATPSHEMSKLEQEAAQNHAASGLMEDELQKSVNGLTPQVLQDVVLGNNQEASRDRATSDALKGASQGPNQTASSPRGSPKFDSREGNLRKELKDENSDVVRGKCNDVTEGRQVEHKEKAPQHCVQDDHLQEPQSQISAKGNRKKRVPVANSPALNRKDGGRGAAADTLAAQPSCSWQYDAKPSCSWQYDPQPSCSWAGEDASVPEACDAKGGKLLAALDLVPCHEASPPGPPHGGKKALSKTRKRRKPVPKECPDVKAEIPPSKKPWNLRTPTKRRRPIVIPDSDDEDFEDYGSDDYPSDAQKMKSEKAFDDLLDEWKAATEAAPARKRIVKKTGCAPSKRRLPSLQSLSTNSGAVGVGKGSAKMAKVKSTERSRPNESSTKRSQAKSVERLSSESTTRKFKAKSSAPNDSSTKTSKAKNSERSAPTESSAKKARKAKSTERSGRNGSRAAKTSQAKSTGRSAPEKRQRSSVASSSAAAEVQQVEKRHFEPASILALQQSAMDCGEIRMLRTDLLAGDIRIRCQKPSYVSAKLPPRYHCSKCDFVSSRMQNIVWHHKQDCPYTKSLSELVDPKSSESEGDSAPT